MSNLSASLLLILTNGVSTLLGQNCFAAEPVELNENQIKAQVVKLVRPEYPLEARRAHQTGRGIFILNVDENTGQVLSIKIEKRTGHRILDVACLKALIAWRFKPHTVVKVRLPITFSMTMFTLPPTAHPTPLARPATSFN